MRWPRATSPTRERAFDRLPAAAASLRGDRSLNAPSRTLDRPGEAALCAAARRPSGDGSLERIAARRCATGAGLYAAFRAAAPCHGRTHADAERCSPESSLRLDAAVPGTAAARGADRRTPTVPRYAPDFAASGGDDPAVQIEIVGLARLGGDRRRSWRSGRGAARPRSRRSGCASRCRAAPSPTDAARTTFAAGSLFAPPWRRAPTAFQLLFTVLPDRPGLLRARPEGAHDRRSNPTRWCRPRSWRARRPARRAPCGAASIRRRAGASTRARGASSSSSGWAGSTTFADRR